MSRRAHLDELDKFQFQHWALSLIDASPLKEGLPADRQLKATERIAAWTACSISTSHEQRKSFFLGVQNGHWPIISLINASHSHFSNPT